MKNSILLDWAEINYANYEGELLDIDLAITQLFKVSTPKAIDDYLNYRPPGYIEDIMGDKSPNLTFLEKSIKMENKKIMLAYLPFLSLDNQEKFINLLLDSHLVLSEKFDIPEFQALASKMKLNSKIESKVFFTTANWMKVILDNPNNNLFNTLKSKKEQYWFYFLDTYVKADRKKEKIKECLNMFLNHPTTPIELLIEINEKIQKASTMLSHIKLEKKVKEEILLPLQKTIALKEVKQIQSKLKVLIKPEDKKLKL